MELDRGHLCEMMGVSREGTGVRVGFELLLQFAMICKYHRLHTDGLLTAWVCDRCWSGDVWRGGKVASCRISGIAFNIPQ